MHLFGENTFVRPPGKMEQLLPLRHANVNVGVFGVVVVKSHFIGLDMSSRCAWRNGSLAKQMHSAASRQPAGSTSFVAFSVVLWQSPRDFSPWVFVFRKR